jgi:hypothetical protein
VDVSGLVPGASQTSISQEGELFGELSSLAQSDPERFKKVSAEIAQKLKEEASQATGGRAQYLSKLSDKFGQASQTGDMSALKPDGVQGARGHHGHHRHAAVQAAGAAQSTAADPLSEIIATALKDVDGAASSS